MWPLQNFALSPSGSVGLKIDGVEFKIWTNCTITRDLSEICGSFHLECYDLARAQAAMPASVAPFDIPKMLKPFKSCEILIDGEKVMKGWVEDVEPMISGNSIGISISGRDVVGDLVDCAANPTGPSEYFNISVEEFAARLCGPFRIKVKTEVDTGELLKKASIDHAETVMSAIEKHTRKRAILILSNGFDALILSRSGTTRAPGDITLGVNCTSSQGNFSEKERFSDVFVKGQVGNAGGLSKETGALDVTAPPLTSDPLDSSEDTDAADGNESRAIGIQGHAQDPDVGRWRPTVRPVRSNSVLKEAKTQAQWYVNNARGKSETVRYLVPGFRINGELWRPNQLTHVKDAYQDIDKDLLIAGVTFTYGDRGSITELRVTGKEAYEEMQENDSPSSGGGGGSFGDDKTTDLITTAPPLEAGSGNVGAVG